MDELDKMVDNLKSYCTANHIEYLLAYIDANNDRTRISTNVTTNVILTKSVKILKKLL